MRGQAEGLTRSPKADSEGGAKGNASPKQRGQREAPDEAETAASWVSERIQLSFKKNPIGLQIPPRNAESHGPPAGRADQSSGRGAPRPKAPDAERQATAPGFGRGAEGQHERIINTRVINNKGFAAKYGL